MNVNKRSALLIAGILCAVLIGAASPFALLLYGVHRASLEIEQRKRLVLYHTDHAALLAACLDVWNKRAAFHHDFPMPTSQPVDFGIDPDDPALPAVIRAIHPTSIAVLESSMVLELGGGFDHFGINAYVKGAPDANAGDKELIPGLWFYAEDGKVPEPPP